MAVEIVVDFREGNKENPNLDLIQKMKNRNIDFVVERLELGDIIFRDKKTGEILVLIERKTMNDLAGSINDKRWREQKSRILKVVREKGVKRALYLIEGLNRMNEIFLKSQKFNRINYQTLVNSISNTLLRDDLKVIKTDNISETIEMIQSLHKTTTRFLVSNANINVNTNGDVMPMNYKLPAKGDDMNPKKCFLIQLTVIPGLSEIKARVISDLYPSFKSLIQELDNLGAENMIKKLKEIKITTETSTRKLGPVLAKRIVEYIE